MATCSLLQCGNLTHNLALAPRAVARHTGAMGECTSKDKLGLIWTLLDNPAYFQQLCSKALQ